ncbi:MAG: ribbon-helix-helix protein, CopG family [Firmicutes bacterium]|nr:ribbon-helix-helix protein, CopG family [Bacillota bacterium]MBQ2455308.1 ribbon-helix-helix protein, CopG family [Bacillota bacterium]
MTISLRLSDEDADLIKRYSELHNISVSELVRQAVLEKIEDEYDLKVYQMAADGYKADPAAKPLDEVEKEILSR